MKVNVLGTEYSIIETNKVDDINLEQCAGYCDASVKKIVIDTFQNTPGSMEDLDKFRKQVIRHELIHAFLSESGLECESWAKDEEIVDWIAIQFPKLIEAFEKANAI
ncbi:MAG: hypothetical protein IKW21_02405 [Lachnospiraceae bacterium]|nr:hypothetical protein [Lachnospiraceae bacterium]